MEQFSETFLTTMHELWILRDTLRHEMSPLDHFVVNIRENGFHDLAFGRFAKNLTVKVWLDAMTELVKNRLNKLKGVAFYVRYNENMTDEVGEVQFGDWFSARDAPTYEFDDVVRQPPLFGN